MSQKSRRFIAAREASFHPNAQDHSISERKAVAPLVPMLEEATGDANKGFNFSAVIAQVKDKVSEQVKAHGESYLDRSKDRMNDMTSQMVTWSKKHPVRMVTVAAAFIAVSGILYKVMHGKADKVAAIVTIAKKAKTRIKGKVTALAKGKDKRKTRVSAAI